MYHTRFLPSLADVSARDWDALHDGRNPFVAHAFLHGLESQGCLRRDWGWTPHHLTLWEGDTLVVVRIDRLEAFDSDHGSGQAWGIDSWFGNDIEGEATCHYISEAIHAVRPTIKISRIGFGLPSGSGLTFADPATLRSALEGRRDVAN